MSDGTTRVAGSSNNRYEAVFTDKKDNSQMTQSDFMKLMVAQMQNQDFNNPMDNDQMISQMATFSNMQQMQEMTSYSKTNYAMALVGKTVTASRFTVSGQLETTTGPVEKVSLADNEYIIYVGGKRYTLSQIMGIEAGSSSDGGGEAPGIKPENYEFNASEVTTDSAKLSWQIPTEDGMVASKLSYSVYYSTEGPFTTVEEIEKNGTSAFLNLSGTTSETIKDLKPNTIYYMNVVVKDANGAKSVYKPVTVKTKQA